MIYMIEINYTDAASESEWDEWYEVYLRELVTVPGIDTAQRFRGDNTSAHRHLAVYTFAGLSVYSEPRYHEIGGGGFASAKWRQHIKRRRNLYDGLDYVPKVTPASRLIVTEEEPAKLGLPDILFVDLAVKDMRAVQADPNHPLSRQVPFENDPPRRFLSVVPAGRAAELAANPAIDIYRPSSEYLT